MTPFAYAKPADIEQALGPPVRSRATSPVAPTCST